MKKHNMFKVIGITILAVLLFTWILPTGSVEAAYSEMPRSAAGLFDILTYPGLTLNYFNYVITMMISTAIFYGIFKETHVADKIINKLTKNNKNPLILVTLLILFLSLYVSITGSVLTALFFVPFIIGIILRLGYSKKVAGLVTVGSIATGVIGTTIGLNTMALVDQVLGLDFAINIIIKVALFLTTNGLLLFFVNEKIQEEGIVKEELTYLSVKGKKEDVSLIPFGVVAFITVLILILGFMPWDSMGIHLFEDMTNALLSYNISGANVFGLILGNISWFGTWSATEAGVVIVVAALILGFAYSMKLSEMIEASFKAIRKVIYPAGLMMLAYTVLILATYHPFQVFIYNHILNITKGFNVITTTIVGLLANFLNVETMYAASASLPLFTILKTNETIYPVVQILFQATAGVNYLLAPTSIILIGVLSHLGIEYKEWFKYAWKLTFALLALSLLVATGVLFFFV